jgi:hypothetical protein
MVIPRYDDPSSWKLCDADGISHLVQLVVRRRKRWSKFVRCHHHEGRLHRIKMAFRQIR